MRTASDSESASSEQVSWNREGDETNEDSTRMDTVGSGCSGSSNQVEMIAHSDSGTASMRNNDNDHSFEQREDCEQDGGGNGVWVSSLMQIVESAESKLMRQRRQEEEKKRRVEQMRAKPSTLLFKSPAFATITTHSDSEETLVVRKQQQEHSMEADQSGSFKRDMTNHCREIANERLDEQSDASSKEDQREGATPTNDLIRSLIHRDTLALRSNFCHISAISDSEQAIRAEMSKLTRTSDKTTATATLSNGIHNDDSSSLDGAKVKSGRCKARDKRADELERNLELSKLIRKCQQIQLAPDLTEDKTEERRHSHVYLLPLLLTKNNNIGQYCTTNSTSMSDDEEPSSSGKQGPAMRRLSPQRERIRASASSPSALSTPTNELGGGCGGHCCSQQAVQAKLRSENSTIPHQRLCPPSTPTRTFGTTREVAKPRKQSAGDCHAHKRHSIISMLNQSNSHLVNRLSHPKTFFTSNSMNSNNNNSSSKKRASLDCQLTEHSYDPLIPESGFKIVVMGTSGSGKTAIIQRFMYNSFNKRHLPTVEDTYFIEFPYMKNIINISISDTSGTYQFPAMRRLAINSGDAFILVYSVDNPQSFDDLNQLRQTILEEREQAYLETSASLSSTDSSSSSGLASGCISNSSAASNNNNLLQLNQNHSIRRTSDLSPSRNWSLSSLFNHHHNHYANQPNQQQQQQTASANQSLNSSLCSSTCSSNDNSRRSSVSAAEAALRTRRTRRPPMVIVANKYDLPKEQHLVNSDEKEFLAVFDWSNGFVKASAANNENINEIFQQVLKQARQPPTLADAILSKRRKSLPPKLNIKY